MLKVKDFIEMVGHNLIPNYKVIYEFNDGDDDGDKWIYTDSGEVVVDLFGEWYMVPSDSIYIDCENKKEDPTVILYISKEPVIKTEKTEDIQPDF